MQTTRKEKKEMLKRKWKSWIALIVVVAVITGILPDIPQSVSETEAAYTDSGTNVKENSDIVKIFETDGTHYGRFSDVEKVSDGSLVSVCYWNSIHAAYSYGESFGKILISYGSKDGKTWTEPEELITEDKLAEWGLGIWGVPDYDAESDTDNTVFYYNKEEAENADAIFMTEARDPNLNVLSDGTLLLSFFTRVPEKCTLNGKEFEQASGSFVFNLGRSYMMHSKDGGKTWSRPTEIESELLSRGCATNGSFAEYEDGHILIPLYGFDSIQSNAYHGSCVYAKLDDKGTETLEDDEWKFERETYMFGTMDGSAYSWEGENTFISTELDGKEVTYALIRRSGNFFISEDRGKTWTLIDSAVETGDSYMEGDDENLQQPKIEVLKGTNKLLFTWVNEYLQGQCNIYAKIYVPGEAWSNTKAVLLYKDVYGGDMGNPTSIELENGKIMTVFYDKGAGFVGAVFNEVDELRVLRSQSELNSKSEQSLEVFHEDFDGKTSGDTYLNQDNNLLWMDKEASCIIQI